MSQPKHLIKDISFNQEDFEDKDYNPHIAYTLPSQGGAASKKNKAFLFKSDQELSVELLKELEQVQLKISMEEFLEKFMGLWGSQAEVLTKLMGFQTEEEYRLEKEKSKDNPDQWYVEYLEEEIEYTDKKVSRIQLLKSVEAGEELSAQEMLEVFNIRKAFEEGYFKDQENIDSLLKAKEIPSEVTKTDEEINSDVSGNEGGDTPSNINKNNKEITVENIQEILKSAEFQELFKAEVAKATAEKDAQIEELVKAENARLEKGYEIVVKGFEFLEADDQVELVKFCMKDASEAKFVTNLLKAANEAVVKAQEEAEEVKKSFGEIKSEDGQIDTNKTDVQKADESLAEFEQAIKDLEFTQ